MAKICPAGAQYGKAEPRCTLSASESMLRDFCAEMNRALWVIVHWATGKAVMATLAATQ